MANDHLQSPNDDELNAFFEGELTPEQAQRLRDDPALAGQVEAARQLEQTLKSALFRWDCPESQQLGAYHLHLLDTAAEETIAVHLEHCIHCRAELAAMEAFLLEGDMPPVPVEKSIPRRQLPRFPSLGDIVARLIPRTMQPALAMRGDAGRGPLVAEAEGVTVFMEFETAEDRHILKGQLVTEDQDRWIGALLEVHRDQGVQATTTLDEFGAFQCALRQAGMLQLRFIAADGRSIRIDEIPLE